MKSSKVMLQFPYESVLTCLYWRSHQSPEEEKTKNMTLTEKLQSVFVAMEAVDVESHHLSEDFGVFGPGEGSVWYPAWHQPLIRVGSRPLHLSHHRLLLLLLREKNRKA